MAKGEIGFRPYNVQKNIFFLYISLVCYSQLRPRIRGRFLYIFSRSAKKPFMTIIFFN